MNDPSDADLIAEGRRAVLERLRDAIYEAGTLIKNGSSGDAPRVAAARFLLDAAIKGPFRVVVDDEREDIEARRLRDAARNAIAEILAIDEQRDDIDEYGERKRNGASVDDDQSGDSDSD